MKIGGLEKLTLIDYPGKIAAIIFTQGCNFRCHFCYNPMLVVPNGDEKDRSLIAEDDLFLFLKSRVGKIDGVVVTGGEPTLHPDLPEFLGKIKKLGLEIKLDSNGTNPEVLKNLIKNKLVDYIAMDIKGPLKKYEKITGVLVNLENIKKSVKIIRESGLPYEFRTTIVPGLHEKEDIAKMGEIISPSGLAKANKWFLQFFKSNTDLIDKDFINKISFSLKEMEEMQEIGGQYVEKCELRGN